MYSHFKFNRLTKSTLLALIVVALPACQPKPASVYHQLEGKTMGTSYHIRYQLPKDVDEQVLKADITQRLIDFNNSLSTYQDDSTISQFNRLSANTPMVIDADFIKVFKDSQQVYQQSAGAFDPTVKPIFELWGFGKTMFVDRLQAPPKPAEIEQAKGLIGFDKIQLQYNALSKRQDGVEIDFSAIAKGYGVDVIAEVLASKYHINNYMVEIGGEVATSGVNDKGKGWRIAIDAPILHSGVSDRQLITTLTQPVNKDKQGRMHLATSGNYRNSIVFEGVRYSHTIDPTTARPIVGGAPSVTVADTTVALADAWATAFTAMPYKQALKMANELDKAVMFVVLKEGVEANQDKHTLEDWQIVETEKMKAFRSAK